jgi:dethiobiotin synthetase
MKQTLFITGTDTGVGKTVLAALLTRFLRERGVNAAALKPVCSGTRADARALHAAMNGVLTLDEINPWHFRSPVAPSLAGRLEKKSMRLAQIIAHVRMMQKRFDILVVEGAGGLLSPLGENFNSRDLVLALCATPIVVALNKIGAVNHILLTLEALPKSLRANVRVVLVSPPKPDAATKSNAKLLAEFTEAKIFSLPWLGKRFNAKQALKNLHVQTTLRALTEV